MIYTAECFAVGMAELSLLVKSGDCEGAKRAPSAAEKAERYFYLFGFGCHAATAALRSRRLEELVQHAITLRRVGLALCKTDHGLSRSRLNGDPK